MKKTKPKTKSAAARKSAKRTARAAKMMSRTGGARKSAKARKSPVEDSLGPAIGALAAIAAELRQIINDLRALITERQPEVDTVVVTEIEAPDSFEQEP